MKKNHLVILLLALTMFTLNFSCKKGDEPIKTNKTTQPQAKTMSGTQVYTTGYRFGWTVFDLSSYCEFCPFWLCKGVWKPTPQPSGGATAQESLAYLENNKLVFEVLVEDYKIDSVVNYIKNGTIELKSPVDSIHYMELPEELVTGLGLSFNKIYPGVYPAHRVEGTDKIKITFN